MTWRRNRGQKAEIFDATELTPRKNAYLLPSLCPLRQQQKVLVIGGRTESYMFKNYYDTVEVYSLTTGKWDVLASLNYGRQGHGCC